MLNILTAPPTDNVPPIVALPTRTESPLIQTSLLKSTLSPNVLFVNVSVVDVPTNVAALVGSVIVILPLKELCGGACKAA